MFANSAYTICSTLPPNLKLYPTLNSIPLRKNPADRPKSSTLKPFFMKNAETSNLSSEKLVIMHNTPSSKMNKSAVVIPPKVLDKIVEENFEYFKDKLQSPNKSIPSNYKLKLPAKTNKSAYRKDFKKYETIKSTKTQRATHKNACTFDEGSKDMVDGATIYQKQFVPKSTKKNKRHRQKMTIDEEAPLYQLSLYSSQFVNWGTKSGNVTLQTRPYSMLRDLPFSKNPTAYGENFNNSKSKKSKVDNSNSLATKITYGPKLSNKLKLDCPSTNQKEYYKKTNKFQKKQDKTCIRSKMETLANFSVLNQHKINKETEYQNQYIKKSHRNNKENTNLSVSDLQGIISVL